MLDAYKPVNVISQGGGGWADPEDSDTEQNVSESPPWIKVGCQNTLDYSGSTPTLV